MPVFGGGIGLAFKMSSTYICNYYNNAMRIRCKGTISYIFINGNQELFIFIAIISTILSFGNIPLQLFIYITTAIGNLNNNKNIEFTSNNSGNYESGYSWSFKCAIFGSLICFFNSNKLII